MTIFAPAAENIMPRCRIKVNYSSDGLRLSASSEVGDKDSSAVAVIADDTQAYFHGGTDATIHTGTLAAVWYVKDANQAVILKGAQPAQAETTVSGTGVWVKSAEDDSFRVQIVENANHYTASWTKLDDVTFSMNPNANNFVRNMFNTNPTLLNGDITALSATDVKTKYFLGETFETHYHETVTTAGSGNQLGVILKLADGSANQAVHQRASTAAESGWVIAQDTSTDTANFDPVNMQKLFKIKSKHAGQHDSGRYKVSIQDIKASSNPAGTAYGSFTVIVRHTDDNDTTVRIVEQYRNCNLNPASPNFQYRQEDWRSVPDVGPDRTQV